MISETEVDGVRTILASTTGPTRVGLTFRVGRADESLASAGITHMIGRLALHRFNAADSHRTGTTVTDFHGQGSETDVAGFLTGVCDSLSDLPLHRLETERGVVRAEADSRASSVTGPLAAWRHGPRDYGLVGYPGHGVHTITPEDLRQWAADYFTRQNAVLWIAGDRVPPGLHLRLPDGERRSAPAASNALPVTPAYFNGEGRSTAVGAVVWRRTAASVFAGVLERQLFRTLRQEDGLASRAFSVYEPRGDGYACVVALADAVPDKHGAVLGGFVDVLAGMRVGAIDETDVEAVVTRVIERMSQPDVDAARLPVCAFNLLTDYPNPTVDEERIDLLGITVEEVHTVGIEAMTSALLMAPRDQSAEWAGFTLAPPPAAGFTMAAPPPPPDV